MPPKKKIEPSYPSNCPSRGGSQLWRLLSVKPGDRDPALKATPTCSVRLKPGTGADEQER